MLFNSLPFLFLFLITYLIYWNVDGPAKKKVLLVSSVVFYGYSHIAFLIHFLIVIGINYYFSIKLWENKEKGKSTSGLLKFAIVLNAINLASFKYYYFLMDSLSSTTGMELWQKLGTSVEILLPLAISFYTFQLIALQVDIHRDLIPNRIGSGDYFLFILFFPQLIAGPIMRSADFLPKLDHPSIDKHGMKQGIFLLIFGLFKKSVLADSIAGIISPLYAEPGLYHAASIYIATLGFICQVYCDFSGYTDIARGSAFLLGYEIPENFRGPFLSFSFREFWGRWHVTLSTWLRDYIYIPLGGSRKGEFRSQWNLFLTMCLGGLWHGANIAFILWGAYLGIVLAVERILEPKHTPNAAPSKAVRFLRNTITVNLFAFSGIFFRSGSAGKNSLTLIFELIGGFKNLFSGKILPRWEELLLFIFLTIGFNAFQYFPQLMEKIEKRSMILIPTLSVILLLLLGVFGDGGGEFIYFQF
ncbi:MBOAT family O-acyltransferase [Leptospira alstonii]|uniref:Membrane-bound O-acyltransferase family MBOAT n=2 Tax=Leptospira alstonii TaxID=28452 RepID=M6CWU5_9LEPT|nr:MBOAT family O-acyltransferase [Leptospira alstonii]EMJ96174.1 membrane-bound O-acyltransferase family MBOAT [Leptospira alstonii serovar Sichuan str. 79601]EQA79744.1 membrane-bound O-acyltransferase family MBOAT [Leptospira alstonii serovar Pingchang str. 80-412]